MRISLLLILLFVVSCNYTRTSNRAVILDPNALVGKNKAEIIGMTLQSSPKNVDGETIVVSRGKNGALTYNYITSKNQASGDKKLQESDLWFIDFHPKAALFAAKDDCIMLKFKDGVVFESKHIIWKHK